MGEEGSGECNYREDGPIALLLLVFILDVSELDTANLGLGNRRGVADLKRLPRRTPTPLLWVLLLPTFCAVSCPSCSPFRHSLGHSLFSLLALAANWVRDADASTHATRCLSQLHSPDHFSPSRLWWPAATSSSSPSSESFPSS